MSQPRGQDVVKTPPILVSLQRSVISVMLGKTSKIMWKWSVVLKIVSNSWLFFSAGKLDHPDVMSQGLLNSSLLDSFEIKFKNGQRPDVVHSLTSDGSYLYLQSSQGLYKVGSGYGGTVKGHVYNYNAEFYDKSGWMGYAHGSLYFKLKDEFNQINAEDLSFIKTIPSSHENGQPNVLFTDGTHVSLTIPIIFTSFLKDVNIYLIFCNRLA